MSRRKKSNFDQSDDLIAKHSKRKKPINLDYILDINPITENQKLLFKYYDEGKNIFAHGVPGSGKTFCLLYKALKDVLDENTPYEKIYIVRSLVQTREIGFMPGPQPLDAKVLTPTGWSTMGQLKVGDYVIAKNGKPTKVLGVYPKGRKLVYKITTTENTSTECCEDHLWLTETFDDKTQNVKSTKQIIDTLYSRDGKINHYIPRNEPIHFSKKELSISPYVLGVILGDVSISNSISITNTDSELIEKVKSEITENGCYLDEPFNTIQFKDHLYNLGLDSKKSYDKFIPNLYKYSCIEDRIELLRGLMDTNGSINHGDCSFTTTSKQLAEDVVELVQSLGGNATYIVDQNSESKKTIVDYKEKERLIVSKCIAYNLNISLPKEINPFYVSRKASKFNPKYVHHIGIKSVEPICEKKVQCILIEDPEHLYITDQYIVTHNTENDKKSLFEIPYKNMVKYMFQMPSDVDFEMLYGNLKEQNTISFWCTSFIRGVTIDNAIIIVDEAQNCSAHESFSVISRCGEDTKIMFSGDIEQSDLTRASEKTGIIDFIRVVEAMPSFRKIEFGVDDICRSPLVKEFVIAKKSLGL